MRSNSVETIGILPGRIRYIVKRVHPGAMVILRRVADNPDDPQAVAVYHDRRRIGLVPVERREVCLPMADGDGIEAEVKALVYGDDGTLTRVDVSLAVAPQVGIAAPSVPSPEPNPVTGAIGDELRILGAVAKAGGRLANGGQELIAKYAEVRCRELGIGAQADHITASMRWLDLNLPDESGLASAVSRLAQPGAFEAMLEVSEIIAEARGLAGAEERAQVARIRSLIEDRRMQSGDNR